MPPANKNAKELLDQWLDLQDNGMSAKGAAEKLGVPRETLYKYKRKYGTGERNILVIGDLHEPFCLDGYLEFCQSVYSQYECNQTIFIGDVIDNHYSSYHEADPDGMGGGQELKIAIDRISRWVDAFPVADVCIGNHDRLVMRKAFSGGIPKAWIKEYKDVLGAPEWTFGDEFVYDGVQYIHGEAGTARTKAKNDLISTVQGHIHCVPTSYKVLTKRGWKPIMDVTLSSDTVAAYKDGRVVMADVWDKKSGQHNGRMYKFDNKLLKQCVTDEHNMYTKDGQYLNIKDFLKEKTNNIVTSALPLKEGGMESNDDMLRLIVAVCADGSYDTSNEIPNIRFHFKKERKIKRLTEIFNSLGEDITWNEQKSGSFKSAGLSKRIRGSIYVLCPDKHLPEWMADLPPEKRAIVIDELQHWDGCKLKDKNVYQFFSSNDTDKDTAQRLLLLNGITSKRYENTVSWIGSERGGDKKIGDQGGKWIDLESPVEVGCISTSVSNFFVMTDDGTIELTGNTQAYTEYIVGKNYRIFGTQVGCGINRESYAAAYAKNYKKQAIGCAVVLESGQQPINILANLSNF